MPTIVISSNNKNKIQEIQSIFSSLGCPITSYFDILKTKVEVIEDGTTFSENAVKKLIPLPDNQEYICLADDSGLEVAALNGAPGINSARYAGKNATCQDLCKKLLQDLKNKKNRAAKFTTVIALKLPNNKIEIVTGEMQGQITQTMRGQNGFGYDPIFQPNNHNQTFAEMTPSQKNQISHRYQALIKAKEKISVFLAKN
jgi:XTP/dITP diphosphohydrolase